MTLVSESHGKVDLRRLGGITAICVATAALAGCGGSSSSKTSTQQASPTPAQSSPDVGRTQVGHAQSPSIPDQHATAPNPPHANRSITGERQDHAGGASHRSAGEKKIAQARPQPGTSNDEHNGTGAKPFNPCTLVSLSEAEGIVGSRIAARSEAPLGPTCIYKLDSQKSQITLAVASIRLSDVKRQMKHTTQLTVAGRQAYCGKLGIQTLSVPLPRGQVLNVTAPCSLAQRFAETALGRLAA
jgi:hypothetical protein